jgi:RHS repeat-associated protein
MRRMLMIAAAVTLFLAAGSPLSAQQNFCSPPFPPGAPPPPDPPCPACDSPGGSPPLPSAGSCDRCTRSPVYVSIGNYTRSESDVQIRTAGQPIVVSRYYDSNRGSDGPFGVGWSSSLTTRLVNTTYLFAAPSTYAMEADVVMPHGTVYRFQQQTNGAFTPPTGRRDTLVKNGDGTFTLTWQDSSAQYRFNSDGTLASATDEYGNAHAYTYDGNGRLQRVTDQSGSGRYVEATWVNGRISYLTDSAGRQWKYTYHATQGTLETFADAVASPLNEITTRYTYVAGRQAFVMSRVEDRWSRAISAITWDAKDRVTSYTDGTYDDANPTTSTGEKYRYEYLSSWTRKTDSFGNRTHAYNALGLVSDELHYDSSGNLVSLTDPGGNTTSLTYDAQGRLSTKTVSGVTWTYTYDTAFPARVISVLSNQPANWRGWKYDYYQPGSLAPGSLFHVRRVRSDGTTIDDVAEYTYDSKGRLTRKDDVSGATTYSYYSTGELFSVTGAISQTFEYDNLGRMTKSIDYFGKATTYTYDANDRVLTMTLPKPSASSSLTFTTAYTYDNYDSPSGLVFTHATDPNDRLTKQGYDALGNLVKSVDALNNATTYYYQYNLLRKIRDANGNETTYGYDANRQLASTTFPNGAVESYTRHSSGRLISMTDRKGTVTQYSYDAFERLSSMTFTPSAGSPLGVAYNYTGEKLTSVSDSRNSPTTVHQFLYDSSFRIEKEILPDSSSVSYLYHPGVDLVATMTFAPPTGNTDRTTTTFYNYDSYGRLRETGWNGVSGSYQIAYDPRGMYSTVSFPGGLLRQYTYDDQGRLTTIANGRPATGPIADFNYGYDYDWATSTNSMLGQRTSIAFSGSPAAQQYLGMTKYRYDAAYQLTGTDYADGNTFRWTYDPIGNRTAAQWNANVTPYTYEPNVSGGNSPRLKNSGSGADYTYDPNGNVATGPTGVGALTWDVNDRVVSQGGLVSYAYDYAGRRTSRTQSSTTKFFYSAYNLIRERNTTLGVLNDYIFAPGIDEPLARRDAAGTVTDFLVDGLNSIVATTTAAGDVTATARYTPWGEVDGVVAPFGYTGREMGPPGIYYRARYYEPGTGRFLSEDPLGYPPDINVYRYTLNRPTSLNDPLGMAGGVAVVVVEAGLLVITTAVIIHHLHAHPEMWDLFRPRPGSTFPSPPGSSVWPADPPVQPGHDRPRPEERYRYPLPIPCGFPEPGQTARPPRGPCDYPDGLWWVWARSAPTQAQRLVRGLWAAYWCSRERM